MMREKFLIGIFSLMFILLFAVGCQKSPSEKRNLHDPENILSGFDLLTKVNQTSEIDFKNSNAAVFLRTGWGKRKKQLAWSRGRECTLVFYTFDSTTDKEMILSCVPAAGVTSKKVSVSLNGSLITEIDLRDTLRKYTIILPSAQQKTGQNLLAFSFTGKPDQTHLEADDYSLGFEKIVFAGVRSDGEKSWHFKKNGHLYQASNSSFSYALHEKDPVRLRVEYKLSNRVEGLIKIQKKGHESVLTSLSSQKQKAEFDIAAEEDSPVMIEFIASGPGKGKIIWKKIGIFPQDEDIPVSSQTETSSHPSDPLGEPRPDIIFYVIDALRSDHLGCYGYKRNTSPNMDSFAEENSLFLNAFANASWTRPSGATLQTGLRVKNHKAMMRDSVLSEKLVTLAEILQQHGYFTAAFNTNGNVGKKFGFDQGFDFFKVMAEDRNRESIHVRSNMINKEITKFLKDFLAKENRPPLFLWIWSTDPHDPYTPHESVSNYFNVEQFDPVDPNLRLLEKFTERVQKSRFSWPAGSEVEHLMTLYDQEILFNDISFGKLLNKLNRRGLYDDALIILTADHGEEFKDHGWYGHGKTLFNEQIKIPLIIKSDALPKGANDIHVQHTDLYPTICDILNISLPYELDGDSILKLDRSESRPIYSEEALDGHYLRSLILGPNKFIHNLPEGKYLHLNWRPVYPFEMYNIKNDIHEKSNIFDPTDPDCLYLKQRLNIEFALPLSRLGIEYQKTEIPEKMKETLRALGYLK